MTVRSRYLKGVGARATNPATTSRRIESAVQRSAGAGRVVLAVSGGRDSMVLLHAAARATDPASVMVATFDHASGGAATRAAHFVAAEAGRLGLAVVIGRAAHNARSEAGWREARQSFLTGVASAFGARVMTAHTRDDQVETVLMRVLRDTGARGLAGLYARGATLRPLLEFTREDIAAYASAHGLAWAEDPTNRSTAFLRNRVRRDLLPALHRVSPGLDAELLAASRRAADLRARLDEWVAARVRPSAGGQGVTIGARELEGHTERELAMLWPAIAASAGAVMDWRGTMRAAAFTLRSRVGGRIPLSGGWEIWRSRSAFEIHPAGDGVSGGVALEPVTRWGNWRFEATRGPDASDPWIARLPDSAVLRVRAWRPGDRMRAGGMNRRVKRYLSDAGVSGTRRAHWPVVLDGDEIVWIPGVRRSDAAAVRSGRPGTLFRCDCDRR